MPLGRGENIRRRKSPIRLSSFRAAMVYLFDRGRLL
jgi:hypothetical protein